MADRIEALEQQLSGLITTVGELEEELHKLRRRTDNVEDDVDDLKEEVTELRQDR